MTKSDDKSSKRVRAERITTLKKFFPVVALVGAVAIAERHINAFAKIENADADHPMLWLFFQCGSTNPDNKPKRRYWGKSFRQAMEVRRHFHPFEQIPLTQNMFKRRLLGKSPSPFGQALPVR